MSSSEEVSKTQAEATQQNDEWTVAAKTRRLVPQHSLSRQDLEADKNKNVPASDATKKKVIRFTKEEMMTFRQPAKLLSNMAEMVEVVSIDRLNPVCFERFEPEDVIRIWNSDKNGPGNKGGVDAAGRGRGRGKTFKNEEGQTQTSGEHVPGDWSTARGQPQSKGGLWDDAGATGTGADGLDLEDFAAMALKFRTEMEQMKLSGEADGELSAGGEEDMMERLLREQNSRAVSGLEDEEEELPDWATEDVAPAVAPQPAAKRSLLLETLNVKPAPAPVAAPAPVPVAQPAYNSNTLLSNNHASLLAPPPLLRVEPSEWLYTDPQGNVQGPFEQDNMRAWHEAGYFNADLPIKLRHWSGFHAFQTVFPDFKRAFLNVPSEPGSSLLLSLQQQQHQQQLRQQQLLQQQQAEELARQQHQQKLEQERAIQEAQARAHAQRQQQLQEEENARRQQLLLQQQQQAQLAQHREQQQREQLLREQQAQQQQQQQQQRALLEQERQAAAAAAAALAAQPVQKPATVAPWANKQPGPNRSSATSAQESLLAIQSEEKARAEEEKKRQAAEQAKITKGWSGASGAASGPSLAEIQQQEEAARQRQAQAEASRNQAAPATTNMSFQLKSLLGVKAAPTPAVASTGPAWGSPAVTPTPANKGSLRDIMQEEEVGEGGSASPVKGSSTSNAPRKPLSWAAKAGSSGYSTAAPAPKVAPRPVVAASAPVVVAAAVAAAPAPAKAKTTAPSSNNKEKSDFGGKEMSRDMADWCVSQLKRLNGSDDITLMQFCMSLDSAVEVREYLSEYLGSSPAVINFATDFIKYKEGGRRAVGSDSSSAPSASAGTSGSNNNNPSAFVSANKKKKGPVSK